MTSLNDAPEGVEGQPIGAIDPGVSGSSEQQVAEELALLKHQAMQASLQLGSLVLYGDPKLDEPLALAWQRCLQRWGHRVRSLFRLAIQNKTPAHMGRGFKFIAQTVLDLTYFSAVCTLPNVPFKFVPTPCTTAMIATEIPAAMRPYSIAVAPDSHFKKELTSSRI